MRKDVESGLYVSKDGLVFRLVGRWRDGSKHLELASTRDSHGYVRTCTKKSHYVHRIVYRAFKGEIGEGLQVDHIDGDKLNNSVDNLQLLTAKENSQKAWDMGASKPNSGCFKRGFTPWNQGMPTPEYVGHYKNGFSNQYT